MTSSERSSDLPVCSKTHSCADFAFALCKLQVTDFTFYALFSFRSQTSNKPISANLGKVMLTPAPGSLTTNDVQEAVKKLDQPSS